jgi:hypothetical protein
VTDTISNALLAIGLICIGVAVLAGAVLVAIKSWGKPEERADVIWMSAVPPELPPAPVEVIRLPPAPAVALMVPTEHVEVSEAPAPAGAIGTVADEVSADLAWWQTARERNVAVVWDAAHAEHDLWLMGRAIDEALASYEDAMLILREWPRGILGVDVESTQQRIDRWLREGGDGVSAARAETRRVASDTWDAPSRELSIIDRPDAERVAEAILAS